MGGDGTGVYFARRLLAVDPQMAGDWLADRQRHIRAWAVHQSMARRCRNQRKRVRWGFQQ
ncbi:MAG: hypothetical protein R3C40_09650 [Parvularculaceae bacterium]